MQRSQNLSTVFSAVFTYFAYLVLGRSLPLALNIHNVIAAIVLNIVRTASIGTSILHHSGATEELLVSFLRDPIT